MISLCSLSVVLRIACSKFQDSVINATGYENVCSVQESERGRARLTVSSAVLPLQRQIYPVLMCR